MDIDQKLVNRAFLSKHDFEECNKFLNEFIRSKTEIIKESLLISALVAYTRPFSENKEHEKVISKIPFNRITRPLIQEEKKLHKKLITIRNQAIAHSVFDKKPTGSSLQGHVLIQKSKPYSILTEEIDINKMNNLTEKMISICEDIICKEQRKLGKKRHREIELENGK